MFLKTFCNIGCRIIKVGKTKIYGTNITRNIYANCTKLSQTSDETRNVSDLSEYTSKQLFYHKVKEVELSMQTVSQTLSQLENDCELILDVVAQQFGQNKLLDNELYIYYSKLYKSLQPQFGKLKRSHHLTNQEKINSKEKYTFFERTDEDKQTGVIIGKNLEAHNHILHDARFQILLKQSVLACQYLPARHLSKFYRLLTVIGTPITSSIYQHLVSCMQTKINDFSLLDISECLAAIATADSYEAVTKMLRTGLLLHLENIVADEDLFSQNIHKFSLINVLFLLKNGAKYGSNRLTYRLWNAGYSIYIKRGYMLSVDEAFLILLLYKPYRVCKEALVEKAIETYEKQEFLLPWQNEILEKQRTNLKNANLAKLNLPIKT